MTNDARLSELLLTWEDHWLAGRDLSPEEICRDCPELQAEFEVKVQVLRHMLGLIGSNNSKLSSLPSPQAGFAATITPGKQKDAGPVIAPPGYHIDKELGRGGMGVVYRAVQLQLNRPVALKMILAGPHADAASLARFVREAETIGRLKHTNVVQVYECGTHDGRPYFSLELLQGGSLADRLRGEPQPPREAATLVAALASAVEAAHGLGIVHRDLKPANVLLDADGTPKVSDFGIAKQIDSGVTATGTVMGTPSYMAPEQARGDRDVGPSADIYSLGAILYELLTGRPPFRGESAWDTVQMVMFNEPVAPRQLQPKVPRDLETICLKCLHKEPRRRYASAKELGEDLQRFLEDRPIHAKPVGSIERIWRAARRNPAIASLALLLVLTLLGGMTASTVLWQRAVARSKMAEQQRRLAEANAETAREHQQRAEEQERAAREEANRANYTTQFLTNLFKAADPVGLDGLSPLRARTDEGLTAIEVLDRGAELLQQGSGGDPATRADVMDTLGNVYCTIGYPHKAKPLLEAALAYRRSNRSDPVRLSATLHNLGWLYHYLGDYTTARSFYDEAIQMRRQRAEQDPLALSTTMLTYAWMLADADEHAAAEKLLHEAIELRKQHVDGNASRDVAVAKLALVGVLLDQQKVLEAVQPFIEATNALKQIKETAGVGQSLHLFHKGLLSRESPLAATRNLKEAVRSLRESLKLAQANLGRDHPFTAFVEHELAVTLKTSKQLDEAETHFREALRIARPFGLDHPRVRILIGNFCRLLADVGKRDEAIALLDEAISTARQREQRDPVRIADLLVIQADVLDPDQDRARIERQVREALAVYQQAKRPLRHGEVTARLLLGELLGGAEAFNQAAELALRIAPLEPGLRRIDYSGVVVRLLEQARNDKFAGWREAQTDPRFESVRNYSEFRQLFKSAPKRG